MPANASLIEINGRLYDAHTGQLAVTSSKPAKRTVVTGHQVIDGFIKQPRSRVPEAKLASSQSSGYGSADHHGTTPAAALHSQPQRTSRLLQIKPLPKLRGNDAPTIPNQRSLAQQRDVRAKEVKQHSLVSRFSNSLFTRSKQDIEKSPRLKTQVADRQTQKSVVVPEPTKPSIGLHHPDFLKRIAPASTANANEPVPAKPDKRNFLKRYLIPASLSFASLLVLAGFFIYNSIPNLSMRVAASRAGFDATVPAYHPSGFSFEGPVAYSPGKVVIRFASNTDDRQYLITQKESSWDSLSLLDNFVDKESEDYLTFQEHGITIYLFDGSQATWVDGGVWYTIDNSANLSSEQILKIAASL